MKILIEQEGQMIEMTEEELANYIKNHNCVKSKNLKCPLRDVCYGMVDDDDECNARLEDCNKGRADAIEEVEEKLNNTGTEIIFDLPVEEILGEDIDLDDFAMLVQDAVQVYRKMVLGILEQMKGAEK